MIAQVSKSRANAFSLVEVVIALGVAASGVLIILALIPGILKQQADSEATYTAVGMPDAITAELKRIAGDDIGSIANRAAAFENETSAFRLVMSRVGTDLREAGQDSREQFYLIELYQFPSASSLSYHSHSGFVALQARVSWPFRPAGDPDAEVSPDAREWLTFNVAVTP